MKKRVKEGVGKGTPIITQIYKIKCTEHLWYVLEIPRDNYKNSQVNHKATNKFKLIRTFKTQMVTRNVTTKIRNRLTNEKLGS